MSRRFPTHHQDESCCAGMIVVVLWRWNVVDPGMIGVVVGGVVGNVTGGIVGGGFLWYCGTSGRIVLPCSFSWSSNPRNTVDATMYVKVRKTSVPSTGGVVGLEEKESPPPCPPSSLLACCVVKEKKMMDMGIPQQLRCASEEEWGAGLVWQS